jgi:protein-S-isoprenylcysteine O-methyltransferase
MRLLWALCLVWFVAELCLTRRSGRDATSRDRGSLRLIWFVEIASISCGVMVARHSPVGYFPAYDLFYWTAICILVIGFFVRFYAVIYLGHFFTINVAIASDHRLVDTGPYRFIRHPSYTGGLLLFLAIGLGLGNWLSLLIVIVPIFIVFWHRMNVEEAALSEALGEPYRAYMKRTKRLIPLIY